MAPPGWRPPGRIDPRASVYAAYEAPHAPGETLEPEAPEAPGGPALPTAGLRALSPILWPGLHLVIGPHGSGSTQLGVQCAVEAATMGIATRLHLPEVGRREAALRVAAALSGTPWGLLAARAPGEAERALDRVGGAPFTLDAIDEATESSPDPLETRLRLLVLDPAPTGRALAQLRRRAIARGTAVLAVAASRSPVDAGADGDAFRLDLPEADAALADQVLVVWPAPGPRTANRPHPTRVGVTKSRRGVPGWARLTFDGAIFADARPDEQPTRP